MSNAPEKKPRGRPRVANRKRPGDYPELRVRCDPQTAAWVAEQGGPDYIRRLISADRERKS